MRRADDQGMHFAADGDAVERGMLVFEVTRPQLSGACAMENGPRGLLPVVRPAG
jgi:hypothetical protein